MTFFSKTVEGSVLSAVQDVRSLVDRFLPRWPPPPARVFIWMGSTLAGGQVSRGSGSLHSPGCLEMDGVSHLFGENGKFPSKSGPVWGVRVSWESQGPQHQSLKMDTV